MSPTIPKSREPVQAWLDRPDLDLLDELAARTGQPKAEVIRQAIRSLARELQVASQPGAGLGALTGVLTAPAVPTDLSSNHDAYLYGDPNAKSAKARRR